MGDSFKKISNSTINNRTKVDNSNTDKNKSVLIRKDIWYKRPIGMIAIGVLVVISGKYIAYILGW